MGFVHHSLMDCLAQRWPSKTCWERRMRKRRSLEFLWQHGWGNRLRWSKARRQSRGRQKPSAFPTDESPPHVRLGGTWNRCLLTSAPCQVLKPEPLAQSFFILLSTQGQQIWSEWLECVWLLFVPGGQEAADQFRTQEIDGQALLLLTEDHLVSTMNLKLGPALKLCAHINCLKDT